MSTSAHPVKTQLYSQMGEQKLEFANWRRGINIYSLETVSLADVSIIISRKFHSIFSSDLEDLIAEEMNEESYEI